MWRERSRWALPHLRGGWEVTTLHGLGIPPRTNPRRTILALDLATSCGFAIGCETLPYGSGTWDLSSRPGDSYGVRYLLLRARLTEARAAYPGLGLVVTETAHHRGGAATRLALGYQATVETWCVENGVEHAGVATSALKKHATGKGNADKAAMLAAARRRWTIDPAATDDEIDALWIYDWARTQLVVEAA